MGRPIVHFEIECLNGDEAREFYSKMFAWRIEVIPNNPAQYGLIQREDNLTTDGVGLSGAVCVVPEHPSTTWRGLRRSEGHVGQVTVFVEVPDVERALVLAEELGGKRMQGPDPMGPGMQFGKFADPEGHLVGVVSGSYSG